MSAGAECNACNEFKVIANGLAGERGGKLLPKLLKPGELASKEQKETFRRENSIEGLGDVGRLIEVGRRRCSSELNCQYLLLPEHHHQNVLQS